MAISRVKTWTAETLTADDLNAEFNNILNNATSLVSPVTAAFDFDGFTITLDAAAATTVVSSAAVSWNFTSGAKAGTPGTSGSVERRSAQTFTDSATAGSGTATAAVFHSFPVHTLAATNASVTTTDAATVYIAGAPTAGTNETITNGWSLWVDAGACRFDGNMTFAGSTITWSGTPTHSGTHTFTGGSITESKYSADAVAPVIVLQKSRNATVGSHTVVQSGDDLGSITAYGSDGDSFEPAAQILFESDGTPGDGDMPGRITLWTTADGAASLTERVRITATGSVLVGDTANANNTAGLTIRQGAADNHAFTLKSSDIATGMTTVTLGGDVETDDYFAIEKASATAGGALVYALGETGAEASFVLEAWGGAPQTSDTTGSTAAMFFRAGQHDGANADADMAANSNLAAWAEIDSSGASLTRMLLKADDGELHLGNTTLVALDEEDDVQLVRAMQKESAASGIIDTEYDNPFYNYEKLRAVGLAGEKDKEGFFLFPLQPRLHAHEGAIWQLFVKLQEQAKKIEELQMKLLESQ